MKDPYMPDAGVSRRRERQYRVLFRDYILMWYLVAGVVAFILVLAGIFVLGRGYMPFPDANEQLVYTKLLMDAEDRRTKLQFVAEDSAIIVTVQDWIVYQPSWTRDGRWVVYVLQTGIDTNLYLFDTFTTRLTHITDDKALEAKPVVSPDGMHVAFVRANSSVIIRHLATGDEVHVDSGTDPQWSVDGTKLVYTHFVSRSDDTQINIYERWTGQITTLGPGRNAMWCPTGTQIVYVQDKPKPAVGTDVLLYDTTTGEVTNITSLFAQNYNFYPSWSPDGTYIAFVSLRAYGRYLVVYNTQTHIVAFHTISDVIVTVPAWSPDSTKIVYSVLATFGDYRVVVQPNSQGERAYVIDSGWNMLYPQFRPIERQ